MRFTRHILHIGILMVLLSAGCDSGFDGEPFGNQPPETSLSVRDESLLDNLDEDSRLLSTIRLSWTGDDPDGFVAGFDVRVYPSTETPSAEDGWVYTTSNDSLLLLPLPSGESIANVVVEVRAVDNEDLRDPTPARSIFPIRNSPPSIRFSQFELPPEETFPVVSFAFRANDPDGIQNLKSIGISLNDSTSFVTIPPDIDYVTLFGDQDAIRSGASVVDAAVFFGRGVQPSGVTVPGLLLNGDNTFYIRSTDQADTTSTIERHTWRVRGNTSDVLYVNDFRLASNALVRDYHIGMLEAYMPQGRGVDVWDISEPFTTGSSGTVPRAFALPPVAEPALRMTLSLFKYIYWVSSSTTGNIGTDNLPFVAPVLSDFFDAGGKMLVHSPIAVPAGDTEFNDNAAILLLPLTAPLVVPDSVRRLELANGAAVAPTAVGQSLGMPPLESTRFFINIRPYVSTGANIDPLYSGAFTYRSSTGTSGAWVDPTTVASISSDRRIALFSLPLVNELNNAENFVAPGAVDPAGLLVVRALLDALQFPKR